MPAMASGINGLGNCQSFARFSKNALATLKVSTLDTFVEEVFFNKDTVVQKTYRLINGHETVDTCSHATYAQTQAQCQTTS